MELSFDETRNTFLLFKSFFFCCGKNPNKNAMKPVKNPKPVKFWIVKTDATILTQQTVKSGVLQSTDLRACLVNVINSENVISFSLSQSDRRKWPPLYYNLYYYFLYPVEDNVSFFQFYPVQGFTIERPW
jgi:hypothetical protein